MNHPVGRRTLLGALALLFTGLGTRAHPYIDAMSCPLAQFNNTFKVIAEAVVEKVDPDKKIAILKLGNPLRGKVDYTHLRLNVGAGPGWAPEVLMRHLPPGAPVIVWYYWGEGPKAAVYVNRFFCEFYLNPGDAPQEPGKAWWHLNAIATLYNRTYNGPVEELVPLLKEMLAGRSPGPGVEEKRPPITRESLAALPVGKQPVDPRKLPLPFRPRTIAHVGPPRPADSPGPLVNGLTVQVFEGLWEALPDFGKLAPVKSGPCAAIGLVEQGRDARYALRFSGFLDVPKDGSYTFTMVSNDGAKLSIGDAEVVDNDHFKGVVESSGEIALKAGKHAFQVTYYQNGGFQVLQASWEAPGLPRQPIPPAAFFRSAKP
jgi:hypothetical protein